MKELIFNTFQKELRNKTLIFMFFLTLIIMFMVHHLMNFFLIPLDQYQITIPGLVEKKLTFFYMVISMWSGFLAALMGVQCIKSDFNFKVASQILSLPISRTSYLTARILGTWFIIMGYYLISLLFAFLLFTFSQGWHSHALSSSHLLINIPLSLMVSGLGFLTLITLGVLTSLYFSKIFSLISVMLFSSFISASNFYYINKDGSFLKWANGEAGENAGGFFRSLGLVFHYIFPRIGSLNNISSSLLNQEKVTFNIPLELLHFAGTFTLLLLGLIFIFNKKDLSQLE